MSPEYREYMKQLETKAAEKRAALDSRLEDIEKDLREVKAKGGRFKTNPNSMGTTFIEEFKRTFLEQKEAIRNYALEPNDTGIKLEMKVAGDMSISNNMVTSTPALTQIQQGIIAAPSRRIHIRDILPSETLNTSSILFLKETASQGSPATVAESANKPEIDFTITGTSVPAQVIASYVILTEQMLQDVEGISTFLGQRLLERLLVQEDAQLLNGNGTPPNLNGILNAGNYTAATGTSHIDIEQLIQAISQLELLNRSADAIIVNPADFYTLGFHKGAGSGDYTLPKYVNIQPNGDLTVCGIPVIRTLQQTLGTFAVGNFQSGTRIYFRGAPKIEIFRDSTLAKQNKLMVRCEERLALVNYGSDYVLLGNLFVPDGSI